MLKNATALNYVFGWPYKNVSCPRENASVSKILIFPIRVRASKIICEIP